MGRLLPPLPTMAPRIVLIQPGYRQRFAKMMWRSLGLRLGEAAGGITMSEVLNEVVDRGEADQFAASSDIVWGDAATQKNTPSPSALERSSVRVASATKPDGGFFW